MLLWSADQWVEKVFRGSKVDLEFSKYLGNMRHESSLWLHIVIKYCFKSFWLIYKAELSAEEEKPREMESSIHWSTSQNATVSMAWLGRPSFFQGSPIMQGPDTWILFYCFHRNGSKELEWQVKQPVLELALIRDARIASERHTAYYDTTPAPGIITKNYLKGREMGRMGLKTAPRTLLFTVSFLKCSGVKADPRWIQEPSSLGSPKWLQGTQALSQDFCISKDAHMLSARTVSRDMT